MHKETGTNEKSIFSEVSEIGQNLKNIRQKAGLSQEVFAEYVGVSRQTVINWERGNSVPTADKMETILSKFNTTIDEILGRSEFENSVIFNTKDEQDEKVICESKPQEVAKKKTIKKGLKVFLITTLSIVALIVLLALVLLIKDLIDVANSDAFAISHSFSLGEKDKLILGVTVFSLTLVGVFTGILNITKVRSFKNDVQKN